MRRPARLWVSVSAVAVLLALGPSARAAPASPLARRAATYLEHAQNADGGLGAAPGQPSAQLFAGWGALGLASAGVDVGRLRRAAGDPTLVGYVRGGDATDSGSLERTVLVLRAAGISAAGPARVLAARVSARGSVGGQVNLTAFAVLALRAAGVDRPAVVRAQAWLVGTADADGGYGYAGRGSGSDADDTGAVLEALGGGAGAAGGGPAVRARRRAVAFLRRDQDRDGGFPDAPGAGSNAQSTAWAIQGLIAAGVSPASLRRGGDATPVGYLDSLVTSSGAVRYARGQTQTPVWVTGEALMALTGTALPIVRHAPAAHSRHPPASVRAATGTRAQRAGTGRRAAADDHGRSGARGGGDRRAARRLRPARRPRDAPRPPASAGVARAVARMEAALGALPARIVAGARFGD